MTLWKNTFLIEKPSWSLLVTLPKVDIINYTGCRGVSIQASNTLTAAVTGTTVKLIHIAVLGFGVHLAWGHKV
jgi:hypothetical protein